MNPARLYENHSQAALVAMRAAICADPANRMDGGLYLYTPSARRKLEAIDRAISFHLSDTRERKGDPIPTSGYSGRNCNR